ncbi:MAG: aa3-type cytochrome c oxidase subunit IV [Allosphingosinicella sp.]
MAAEGEIEKDVIVHRKGYEGFIFLMKWGAIISLVLGLIVVLLIRE